MNSLFKKAGATFFFKILGLGLGFLFQIILTNKTTPKIYGQYTMFLTYINLIGVYCLLGMDRSLIKEIPLLKRAKGEKYLRYFFKISIFIFSLIFMGSFIFHKKEEFLYFLLLGIFIKILTGLLDGYLQGKGKILKVTFLQVIFNNFMKIGIFYVLGEYTFTGIMIAYFTAEIFGLLLRIKSLRVKLNNHLILTKREKRKILRYGIVIALISGIGILNQNVDKLFLNNYLGVASVGVYKVNQNYVGLIGIFISPFIAFWPMISKLYHQNKMSEIENIFSNIVKIMVVFCIPTFIFIQSNAGDLLSLFGKEYSQYGTVLIILSLGAIFDSLSGPIGSVLTMTKYQNMTLINTLICMCINILLNFILIAKYGILGVAISTTVSIIINNTISIIANKILLNNSPYKLKIIFGALLTSFIIWLVNTLFIGKIVITDILIINLGIKIILLVIVSLLWNLIFYFSEIKNEIQRRKNA